MVWVALQRREATRTLAGCPFLAAAPVKNEGAMLRFNRWGREDGKLSQSKRSQDGGSAAGTETADMLRNGMVG